jgi:hypothetical protein
MANAESIAAPADLKEDLDVISKYDPELRFRQATGITLKLTFYMTLILSLFHIYTAGFGVLQEWRHRAFHLAFVLPLVFFLYSMRKESEPEPKHFYYDIFHAAVGAMLSAAMFRELLTLAPIMTGVWAAASFGLIFYCKRRCLWSHRGLAYPDFILFSLMLAGLIYGAILLAQAIDFQTVFRDPNKTLIFWSVFLFVICRSADEAGEDLTRARLVHDPAHAGTGQVVGRGLDGDSSGLEFLDQAPHPVH